LAGNKVFANLSSDGFIATISATVIFFMCDSLVDNELLMLGHTRPNLRGPKPADTNTTGNQLLLAKPQQRFKGRESLACYALIAMRLDAACVVCIENATGLDSG
jgi:hypothetical protein